VATWTREVVYEDEHILMEWSRRTPAASTIAVTFDPILVDPGQPAYAASFLHKAGIDTLCVRKKSEHFYQPLSRERFDGVALPVLARYRRRLAYGSSLGAYAVLYFCAHGFDEVISSSPRVSAHPRFGRPHWQKRVTFRHEFFDPERPATSGATVFYDPHDTTDRHFVDEELRPAWPQARFIAVPYAGHPANQFLSEIGFIAPFVSAVVKGGTPPVLERRHAKRRSFTYHHVLGAACLRHGKARWAEALCRRALAMKPDLVAVKLTFGQTLLALGRIDEAEPLLKEFQQAYPQDGDARQSLRVLARERAHREGRMPPLISDTLLRLQNQTRHAADSWWWRTTAAVLWLPSRLRLTVSREDIVWCYRHLLGRAPESEQAMLAHRRCLGMASLVRAIVQSPEYTGSLPRNDVDRHLDRLIHTATLVRRVLPEGGRMLDFCSASFFSPVVCKRLTSAAAGGADRVAAELEKATLRFAAGSFDLCLNTEPLQRLSHPALPTLPGLAHLLRPGGHLLLALHEPPRVEWLQQGGFEIVETGAPTGKAGVRLFLARRLSG
jgi:hypothetical protein